MYCINCGKEIENNANFCKFCGNNVNKENKPNKKKKKKKEYKIVWTCDFCGKEFDTKKESDEHEKICNDNPNNKDNEEYFIRKNKDLIIKYLSNYFKKEVTYDDDEKAFYKSNDFLFSTEISYDLISDAIEFIKKNNYKEENIEVWTCDFCGKEFDTKKESDEHEKICNDNPNNKDSKKGFDKKYEVISSHIQKFYEEIFDTEEFEYSLGIEDINNKEIIKMLIENKVDFFVFSSNVYFLIKDSTSETDLIFAGKEMDNKKSKSIIHFKSRFDRPLGFPLWFIAAYPDVIHWLRMLNNPKYQKKYDKKRLDLINKDVLGKDGSLSIKNYKNIIEHYKNITKKKIETHISENAVDNFYSSISLLEKNGNTSNFTLIAENTTKYYLELNKNYKNRFKNKTSLLATAGILDAQVYVFDEKIITASTIIDIAEMVDKSDDNFLLNFIIELEAVLFEHDMPDFDFEKIRDGCIEEKENILKAIEKTKKEYICEEKFNRQTKIFMESQEFYEYRKMLDIEY